MYFGGPSLAEKEIKELDEFGHFPHMHDPDVYVLTSSWALTCKNPDEIFDISFLQGTMSALAATRILPRASRHTSKAL
jgi:hypothetical protein